MPGIESRYILIDGMRTHYLEAGDGFPVVLLHSGEFGGCAELSWEFTIPALARHFRVIAPDWLGFGESAKVFSFEDMRSLRVQHIASLLRTLCIEGAHFIGNSMGGGMLADVAAQEQPVWPIGKVVLASAGGFAPVNAARKVLNSYNGSREHMRRILETTLLVSALRRDESYIERRHRLSLLPGSWECTAAARFRRPGAESPERSETNYCNIRQPTLIVAGGKDPLREPGYATALQREIKNSELVVFADAGHFPHIDCPDEFNEVVIGFLQR